ncbi:MAPEG family protein [Sphingobium sp.]|uniref:MAPEG family protein n=1 Tax=Sphingobium sp. TaxID=1912891 RepID=UPI0028BF3BCC|nr:MAPEG family protein [Sphingobium sp.]
MLLPITLTLASACALLNMWLGIRCARIRMADHVLHGDGGSALLAKRMRAHANFIEYVPVTLILFGLVELAVGASIWLWGAALVLVVARIGHAFGMDAEKPTAWRAGGALLTWVVMVGLALVALYVAYGATRAVPAPPAMAMIRQG